MHEESETQSAENETQSNFKIEDCPGKMRSLNTRKESRGDDLVLAVDLKIEVVCGISVGDALLGAQDGHVSKFLEGLYDYSGELQYWAISNISYSSDYEDCDLEIGTRKVKGVKLSKFQIEPANMRQCKLVFVASFLPEKGELEKLAELLMRDVLVSAAPPPDLFG